LEILKMAKTYTINLPAGGEPQLLLKINDGQNPSAQFVLTNLGRNDCEVLGAAPPDGGRTVHKLAAGATVIYAIQSEDINLRSVKGTKIQVDV